MQIVHLPLRVGLILQPKRAGIQANIYLLHAHFIHNPLWKSERAHKQLVTFCKRMALKAVARTSAFAALR